MPEMNKNYLHNMFIDEVEGALHRNCVTEVAQLKSDLRKLGSVPDYVREEAERVARLVLSKQNANTLTISSISDMHELVGNAQIEESNLHASQGMAQIHKMTNVDLAVFLGDAGHLAYTTEKAEGYTQIFNALYKISDAFSKANKSVLLSGNHDWITYSAGQNGSHLTTDEVFALFGNKNTDVVFDEGERDRGYCYIDFDAQKVRVIFVNTADIKGFTYTENKSAEYISGTQLKWFAKSLDLSSKENAKEWNIVFCSHHPFDWGEIIPITRILHAYENGTSVSFTKDNVSISYDYSGKNLAKLVCQLHGHVHGFRVDNIHTNATGTTTALNIQRLAIPNACYQRNNEYGENGVTEYYGIEFGEDTTYNKTAETGKDTSFCEVVIDTKKRIIYAYCYGAGYDRVIPYGTFETFTITRNLTNCSSSNTDTSVVEGSNHIETFTSNDGYMLDSATVTMGGVDISNAYNNGTLNIAEVTGNIVITVKAVVKKSTNQIPLSLNSDGTDFVGTNGEDGYKLGYRISTSSGSESSTNVTGIGVTGRIFVPKGGTVRIKNIDISNSASTYATYGTLTSGSNNTGYCNELFTEEGNGVYVATLSEDRDCYFRMSGVITSESILTVNEPIT